MGLKQYHFSFFPSTEQISYSSTLKQEAPPSHQFKGPFTLEGALQVRPTSAQLMLPLLHQSEMRRSPCPKPKLTPPLMAYFLYSSLRGRIWLWSIENRKECMSLYQSEQSSSYLGNIMLEYPPKCLPLCDSTQSTMGPRMLTACNFFDRNSFSDALNLSLRSHLKGRMDLILISLWLKVYSSNFSLVMALMSMETSSLAMVFMTVFCLSQMRFSMSLQMSWGKCSLCWQMRGMQSPWLLYSFSISRNRCEQYLLFITENRLSFICSNSFSTSFTTFYLQLDRQLSRAERVQM